MLAWWIVVFLVVFILALLCAMEKSIESAVSTRLNGTTLITAGQQHEDTLAENTRLRRLNTQLRANLKDLGLQLRVQRRFIRDNDVMFNSEEI